MRNYIHEKYQDLKSNTSNKFTYYKNNKKEEKTFACFSDDIDRHIRIFKAIERDIEIISRVGILGNTSYDWVVADHACIKGGYKSAALPESLKSDLINKIIIDLDINLLLVDFDLKEMFKDVTCQNIFYFNCTEPNNSNIESIDYQSQKISTENLIKKDYSIVFSSGTSQKIKYINREFLDIKEEKNSLIEKIEEYWDFKGSIWYLLKKNKANKLIIYLPLSHPMQRWFIQIAINNKINVVISEPKNCIKHIMTEKPNIMVSIPSIYDAMASMIENRLKTFDSKQNRLFSFYLRNNINTFKDKNIIKKYFSNKLFKRISPIYGGQADLFITGSAPTKKETLETFSKVGVRIYEAYSQSELSTVIMNSPRHFKLGSVGKPDKELKVTIGENNEVLIKYDKENDEINEHILNVQSDFIHTGDSGYIDEDGFLFITGRLDDVIILERGKKVHPIPIENKLIEILDVYKVVVFSNNKQTIDCLIFSKKMEEEKALTSIRKFNEILADYEKIKKVLIVKEKPSLDNGMLTSTLKLKRKYVVAKYNQSNFNKV